MSTLGSRLRAGIGALFAIGSFVALGLLTGTSGLVTAAQAQYGSNDNFGTATPITSLPFADDTDTGAASTEGDEPQFCWFMPQTLWYAYTPQTNQVLTADVDGSAAFANVNVYRSFGSISNLSFLGCAQTGASPVEFQAESGVTYYLQLGSPSGSGQVHVNLQQILKPANDDFIDATTVGSLPYSNTVDTRAATLEASEPSPSCSGDAPAGSAWWAYTPAASGSVTASLGSSFWNELAVYTGNSISSLKQLGCRAFGGSLTLHVDVGTTYYFQGGGLFGARGPITFTLDVAPSPHAEFFQSPSDPSMYDLVTFSDQSFDPAQVGIQSQAWKFGDGVTATGCCPQHRYATDGDYPVELTVTTADGRTDTIRHVVHVKTHDVGIAKIAAPQSANVGQTKQIQVNVFDLRYPETVQVQLLKSIPGGFELVGTLTQSLSPRGKNQTTPYTFNYTFTADDGTVGKVTFKAVATIIGARDALPADNEAIATPTKVGR
jgi:PKD repeat protein